MKRFFLLVLIVGVTVSSFAGDRDEKGYHGSDPLSDALGEIIQEEKDTVVSSLTFGEIEDIMARVSVPMQEAAYINRARSASYMMPGAGQFLTGDKVNGALFIAADLLVAAGTLAGIYFLLPPELQFGQLDYFNTPHSDIKAAWKNAAESSTFMDALATLGVMAGGMIIQKGLSYFSAKLAASRAKQNIEDGTIVFEPRASFFSSRHGHFGFGMGMMY